MLNKLEVIIDKLCEGEISHYRVNQCVKFYISCILYGFRIRNKLDIFDVNGRQAIKATE